MSEVPYRFPEAETIIGGRAVLRFYPFGPLQLGDYLWRSVEGTAHPTAVARSPHGQELRVEVGDAYGIRVTVNGQDCGTYANSAEVPDDRLRAILDDLVRGLKEARRVRLHEVVAESEAADVALRATLLHALAGADLGPLPRKPHPPVPSTQLLFSERRRAFALGEALVALHGSSLVTYCTIDLPMHAVDRSFSLHLSGPKSEVPDRSGAASVDLHASLAGPRPDHPRLACARYNLGKVQVAEAWASGGYLVDAAEPELRTFVAALLERLAVRQAGYIATAQERYERRQAAWRTEMAEHQAEAAARRKAMLRRDEDVERRTRELEEVREAARSELVRRVSALAEQLLGRAAPIDEARRTAPWVAPRGRASSRCSFGSSFRPRRTRSLPLRRGDSRSGPSQGARQG